MEVQTPVYLKQNKFLFNIFVVKTNTYKEKKTKILDVYASYKYTAKKRYWILFQTRSYLLKFPSSL